ncbi:MAG: AAA domain-containing protein [Bacillota bacterium]
MIKIVIADYDKKIGPGDIVGAFINECGVNSDEIGKININSKRAEVEVADRIAQRVVKTMNNNKIGGSQVKVWTEEEDELLSEDLIRFIEEIRHKVKAEKNLLEQKYLYCKNNISLQEREKLGLTINNLKARIEEEITPGRFIVTLYSKIPGRRLPINSLEVMDSVAIGATYIDSDISCEGQIYEITPYSVTILTDIPLPEKLSKVIVSINKSYDKKYYEFLLESIDRLEDLNGSAKRLRDLIFLNKKEPCQLANEQNIEEFHYDLSQEAKETIKQARNARDYYLIAGPAGSGKTKITLELLIQELSNSQRILVVSKQDHTLNKVRNVLDQIKAGYNVFRTNSFEQNELFAEDKLKNADVILYNPQDNRDYQIKNFEMDLALVEDSALFNEAELIFPLINAKRIIMIGDLVGLESDKEDIVKLRNSDYQTSFFTRLFNKTDPLFKSLLRNQYRYTEDIASFVSHKLWSHGKIVTKTDQVENEKHSVDKLAGDPALITAINSSNKFNFIDTSSEFMEEKRYNNLPSYYNVFEAELIKEFVEMHKDIGYDKTNIGIISFYPEQILLLKQKFIGDNLDIGSPYYFQGIEKDIVILSLVRSNDNNYIGKLRNMEALYISLTRANQKIYLFGDESTLAEHEIYQDFINSSKTKGTFYKVLEK